MQVGLPGPELLGSLHPIPVFIKVSGQLLPMERKSWTSSETPISINYKMLDRRGPMSVLLIATYTVFSNVPVYNRHLITISCMNVE